VDRAFQDKNKVVWVRLSDYNYPRMALYLPVNYCKGAMCEAHDSIFGGHNTTQKTYLKISTSNYWPRMFQDIEKQKKFWYGPSKGRNQPSRKHHWCLYQSQTDQIS